MAQINTCLKRTFTIFNLFFAIIGGAIIVLALLCQSLTNIDGGDGLEGRTTGLIVLYVVGGITMVIAILGAYGAHKESKVCLIVFLVCMVIGSLLMLRAGIPSAIFRPQLEGVLEQRFRQVLPLDKASDEVKNVADALQTKMHCCGLFSYTDWEDEIPSSCLCNQEEEMEGLCQSIGYMRLLQLGPQRSVYTKPCFPIMMQYFLLIADIVLGVVFTLAILALLGMTLSSIMIHQMRYPERPTLLMHVPAIFTTPPPKYQELHNPPEY
ncbi:tetraspanin-8-like [Dicentrarchus labrax]|uniref:Tetraspanin n=1 Tax=Dicentrarchus labrax TaxID=13489 RepID=A0A8P4FVD2_DICLA|nr:tetraspanin-8-like [Dicentrarchus labrax]